MVLNPMSLMTEEEKREAFGSSAKAEACGTVEGGDCRRGAARRDAGGRREPDKGRLRQGGTGRARQGQGRRQGNGQGRGKGAGMPPWVSQDSARRGEKCSFSGRRPRKKRGEMRQDEGRIGRRGRPSNGRGQAAEIMAVIVAAAAVAGRAVAALAAAAVGLARRRRRIGQ